MTIRTRLVASVAASAIAAGLMASVPAQAATTTTVTAVSTIGRGASWNAGSYRFGLSSTGWIGLWNGGTQVWGAPTQSKAATSLNFQSDGNLVAYNGASAVWNTGTGRHPGATLTVQTDRNIVIYSTNGASLWSSGTHASWTSGMSVLPAGKHLTRGQYLATGSFRFGLDKTGHLRLTDSGRVIRNASCKYAMPSYLVAQPDGNLVAYSGKRAVFSSGTAHKGGTKLVLQADRNVVIYNGSRAVWTTHTNTKPTSSAPSNTASTLRTDPAWGTQVAQKLGWPAANINHLPDRPRIPSRQSTRTDAQFQRCTSEPRRHDMRSSMELLGLTT